MENKIVGLAICMTGSAIAILSVGTIIALTWLFTNNALTPEIFGRNVPAFIALPASIMFLVLGIKLFKDN